MNFDEVIVKMLLGIDKKLDAQSLAIQEIFNILQEDKESSDRFREQMYNIGDKK